MPPEMGAAMDVILSVADFKPSRRAVKVTCPRVERRTNARPVDATLGIKVEIVDARLLAAVVAAAPDARAVDFKISEVAEIRRGIFVPNSAGNFGAVIFSFDSGQRRQTATTTDGRDVNRDVRQHGGRGHAEAEVALPVRVPLIRDQSQYGPLRVTRCLAQASFACGQSRT